MHILHTIAQGWLFLSILGCHAALKKTYIPTGSPIPCAGGRVDSAFEILPSTWFARPDSNWWYWNLGPQQNHSGLKQAPFYAFLLDCVRFFPR